MQLKLLLIQDDARRVAECEVVVLDRRWPRVQLADRHEHVERAGVAVLGYQHFRPAWIYLYDKALRPVCQRQVFGQARRQHRVLVTVSPLYVKLKLWLAVLLPAFGRPGAGLFASLDAFE